MGDVLGGWTHRTSARDFELLQQWRGRCCLRGDYTEFPHAMVGIICLPRVLQFLGVI